MVSLQNNAAWHFIDRHLIEGRGGKIAYIDAAGAHTFESLGRMVNQAGNLLHTLGVARNDRVMMCLEDGIEFVALFFGALKIGAIAIPINTLLVTDDYRYLVRAAAPHAIAISASLLDRVEPALTDVLNPARVLIARRTHPRYTVLADALAKTSDQLAATAVEEDEVGFWLYSSGSTGGPKGVIHRHGSLLHTARLYGERILQTSTTDVIYSASKMFFAYGLGNACTFPLHAGATAILSSERPTPATVLALLRRYKVTVFFGFPTLYVALLATANDLPIEQFPHLRACVSAGEALPAALAEHWATRFGVEILDGIRSTETLHIFVSNRTDQLLRGTSGKPVDGYDVEIRNDEGRVTTSDQIGDLWCRGPSLAAGYWNNPEATRRTFVDGWLRTGDKYYRDAGGFYHYCGRTDDMLKVGGVWVSPHEVESALIAHPAVLEAAVVGHANADGLIKPKAFVVLKEPATASSELAKHLIQFVKERIAPYKHPYWIEFRTELPKTATGKIRRALLRDSVVLQLPMG